MRYGPSLFHKPNPIHKRGVRNLWHTFNQLGSPRLIYIYIKLTTMVIRIGSYTGMMRGWGSNRKIGTRIIKFYFLIKKKEKLHFTTVWIVNTGPA